MDLLPPLNPTEHRAPFQATPNRREADARRKFSSDFFGAEAIRSDMTDFLVFTLMAGMSVCLIIWMIISLLRLDI